MNHRSQGYGPCALDLTELPLYIFSRFHLRYIDTTMLTNFKMNLLATMRTVNELPSNNLVFGHSFHLLLDLLNSLQGPSLQIRDKRWVEVVPHEHVCCYAAVQEVDFSVFEKLG